MRTAALLIWVLGIWRCGIPQKLVYLLSELWCSMIDWNSQKQLGRLFLVALVLGLVRLGDQLLCLGKVDPGIRVPIIRLFEVALYRSDMVHAI